MKKRIFSLILLLSFIPFICYADGWFYAAATTGGGGTTAPTIRNSAASGSRDTDNEVIIPQPVSGNFIVVFVFAFDTFSARTMSDSAGNTYTYRLQQADSNSNYVGVFTAPVTSTGSGNNTITLPTTATVLYAIEVQGNPSSDQIDGSVTSGTYSGSAGGSLTASAITTTVATDLILSAAIDQNTATLVSNTGTLVWSSSALNTDFNIVQQHTTSATGNYSEIFTVPSSSGETAAIVAIAIKGQ